MKDWNPGSEPSCLIIGPNWARASLGPGCFRRTYEHYCPGNEQLRHLALDRRTHRRLVEGAAVEDEAGNGVDVGEGPEVDTPGCSIGSEYPQRHILNAGPLT